MCAYCCMLGLGDANQQFLFAVLVLMCRQRWSRSG
jgi:hypothetical protein